MWFFLIIGLGFAQTKIEVETNWKGPSQRTLLQEMSEYFAEIGKFWYFIGKIEEIVGDRLNIDAIISKISRSEIEKKLINCSLSNREFSARMEFYSKLEEKDRAALKENCRDFYIINSAASCLLDKSLFATKEIDIYHFDHTMFKGKNSVIAYLDISDIHFSEISLKIRDFCIKNNATYVLRHRDTRINEADHLGGYGVELQLKNHYESQLIAKDNNFKFKALKKLVSMLPNWKRILKLLENFPENIPDLNSTKFSESFKKDSLSVTELNAKFKDEGVILINNHYVPAELFTVLSVLRAEYNAIEELKMIGIPQSTALIMLGNFNLRVHTDISVSKHLKTGSSIGRIYINDLEKDLKYSEWQKKTSDFLSTYDVDLAKVAKNFYNLIAIVDLDKEIGWKGIKAVIYLYTKNYPVRLGFVFLGNPDLAFVMHQACKCLESNETSITDFFGKLEYNMTALEVHSLAKNYCETAEFEAIINSKKRLPTIICDNFRLCGPVHWILNGQVLEINFDKHFDKTIIGELRKEKRNIMNAKVKGILRSPLTSYFENLTSEFPIERNHLNLLDGILNEEIYYGIPSFGYNFDFNGNSKLMTYVVFAGINDQALIFHTLKLFKEASYLKIRIRYIFNSNEMDDEWYKILCYIKFIHDENKKLNYTGSVTDFEEFQCEYSLEYIKASFMKKIPELISGVLINGKMISKNEISSYLDLKKIYDLEIERSGLNNVQKLLQTSIKENKLDNAMEKASYILLRQLSHISYFASYASHPIVFSKDFTKRVVNTNNIYFNIDVLINPLNEKGRHLSSLCFWLIDLGSSLGATFVVSSTSRSTDKIQINYLKKDLNQEFLVSKIINKSVSLTLNIPESWVLQYNTPIYLDDLQLNKEPNLKFSLKHILITGNSKAIQNNFEVKMQSGIGIKLFETEKEIASTFIMKNLGYFQFYANPGIFNISLSGSCKDEWNLPNLEPIIVKDYRQKPLRFNLYKIPLENKTADSENNPKKIENQVINIFSIAEGKTYERFMEIMILSVMSHTKSEIKFWLYGDFLSTNFKNSIEILSEKMKFQYEFVSYKWPSWLPTQKTISNRIFAYRALLFDLFFPSNVTKIISMDADQVVREDISELWNTDLQGNAYGFVPFCESNNATFGFRFWKDGYWQKQLKGKPYFIYALSITDLGKYRSIGVGDILRFYYEYFISSSNSLQNLDQDLVNFIQNKVPITQLPSEWLWCDTWCAHEEKDKAKIIDLCNNPLTKEPKLDIAKRVIPLWKKYNEIVEKLDKFTESKGIAAYRTDL
ncbi:unnamed protein product [Blepharisma stoltei]|uniref:UDP-glucose:glycoprotein glucosyltransferase n=1 Tax=Blepharisma stoltei TaxID=1481888 RepID=A0AAU9IVH7_9CILI|nr:unnamed protein product [Blepharisma stoltei]